MAIRDRGKPQGAQEGASQGRKFPLLTIAWSVLVFLIAGIVGWLWWEGRDLEQQEASVAATKQADAPRAGDDKLSGSPKPVDPNAVGTGKDDTVDAKPDAPDHDAQAPDSHKKMAAIGGQSAKTLSDASAASTLADPTTALRPVPDPMLVAETAVGPLPVIGPDGRQAWRVYARPFEAPPTEPRIAILIGDMGLSGARTAATIQQLPGAVTLGFAPHASDLQHWIAMARAAGHEVMLQLPMEPYDYPANDPGPHALLTTLSPSANRERLEWLLSRFVGYTGVTNYMGAKFTTQDKNMRPVLSVLKERGLLFLDARTSNRSVAGRIAENLQVPLALSDGLIDSEAAGEAIDEQLRKLERIARASSTAVGIGFGYPVTLQRLKIWLPTLREKNIHLAPISAVVNRQPAQ
jgi:hypothetical protein